LDGCDDGMTRFYVDGKWVEIDELIEKANNWDKWKPTISIELFDKLEAIKDMVSTDLSNHDKLNAIEDILIEGE